MYNFAGKSSVGFALGTYITYFRTHLLLILGQAVLIASACLGIVLLEGNLSTSPAWHQFSTPIRLTLVTVVLVAYLVSFTGTFLRDCQIVYEPIQKRVLAILGLTAGSTAAVVSVFLLSRLLSEIVNGGLTDSIYAILESFLYVCTAIAIARLVEGTPALRAFAAAAKFLFQNLGKILGLYLIRNICVNLIMIGSRFIFKLLAGSAQVPPAIEASGYEFLYAITLPIFALMFFREDLLPKVESQNTET